MELRHKILGFAVMCGFALAASVETREHFDLSLPVVFYGIHGVFILGAVSALLIAWRTKAMSGTFALRMVVALAGLYAIAATRASIAPFAVAVVGIATIIVWVLSSKQRKPTHTGRTA